jgi:hypothetical protein
MTNEEVKQIVENSKGPEGIYVQSASGQTFFLSNEDVQRFAIPSSAKNYDLLSTLLKKGGSHGEAKERADDLCQSIFERPNWA